MARFFRTSHPEFDAAVDHSVNTAVTQVAAELATVPMRRPSPGDGDDELRTLVALAGTLAAGTAGLVGWRRRSLFLATLGAVSLAGCVAAIWSTTRIVGEVHTYLLVWTGVLLLPAWIALGLVLGHRLHNRLRGPTLLAVATGLLGTALAWSMMRAPLPSVGTSADVRAIRGIAEPWLDAQGARQVRVRIGEHDLWPLAVGLVNELDRDGVDVSVDREWAALFGDQFSPTARERTEMWLTTPTAIPPTSGAQRLGTAGGASVWAGLTSPSTR